MLESAYQLCFAWELKQSGLRFVSQHPVPLVYGDVRLERCYRLDFMVEDLVVVEVKAVERLMPLHRAQMLTYLRLTGCPVGLVLNFCAPVLKDGIMRVSNGAPDLDDEEYEVDGGETDGSERTARTQNRPGTRRRGDAETQRLL